MLIADSAMAVLARAFLVQRTASSERNLDLAQSHPDDRPGRHTSVELHAYQYRPQHVGRRQDVNFAALRLAWQDRRA